MLFRPESTNAVLRPTGDLLGRRIVDAAFLDAAFLDDPYPTYAALREAGPIHWSDELFGGAWLLTRHAGVDVVLRDSVRYSAQPTGGWIMGTGDTARDELKGFQALFAQAMLFVDEPDHSRLRAVMNAGYRGDTLERLRPRIEAWTRQRLDAVDAVAGFDFIEAVARPLPAQAIAALMGIDDAEQGDFIAWSNDLASFIGATRPTLDQARRAQASLLAMAQFFEPLAAQRRRAPYDDMISRLVKAEADGTVLGVELLTQCAMLLFAGHETTRNLLGNGLRALLLHADAAEQLQGDRSLLPTAVRELLRYDSPVQYTGRRVTTDHLLLGQWLRRGDLVVALIGSANRDPARFERPDRLDLGRRAAASLSFGAGPHVCLGAALTLMEAQVVLQQVLGRWPRLRLDELGPSWSANPAYRGLARLRVREMTSRHLCKASEAVTRSVESDSSGPPCGLISQGTELSNAVFMLKSGSSVTSACPVSRERLLSGEASTGEPMS